MKRKSWKYASCAFACCCFVSAVSLAGTTAPSRITPYFGVQLGAGRVDLPGFADTIVADEETLSLGNSKVEHNWLVAGRLLAGIAIPFHQGELGIEAGYTVPSLYDYEILNGDQTFKWTYQNDWADLLLVLKYCVTPDWYVFGKAGGTYTRQKFTFEGNRTETEEEAGFSIKARKNEHETQPVVHVGLGYKLTDHWNMDLSYMHLFGHKPDQVMIIDTTAGPHVSQGVYDRVASFDGVMLGIDYHV